MTIIEVDLEVSNVTSSNSSFDLDNYIATFLGPKRLDVSVPMTILYCFLWFFGMAGEENPIFFSVLKLRLQLAKRETRGGSVMDFEVVDASKCRPYRHRVFRS